MRSLLLARRHAFGLASVALVLAACGSDDDKSGSAKNDAPGAQGAPVTINGKARDADGGEGLEGVKVRATVDRNGNGTIDADEQVETTTKEDGTFELTIASAANGKPIVVAFRESGHATTFRTVRGAVTKASLDVTLLTTEPLDCNGGRCTGKNGSLDVVGLGANVAAARGRTFNPVTEREAFPGRFGDDKGNLLLSGVFSLVELEDENDEPLHQLDKPVTLSMRMPRDTWPVIVDITPGNDRIEVPLFAFDEVSGEWVRDGQAHLVDTSGAIVPESALASLRDGSFAGTIVARGEVKHFSYWNVDWPIESQGCVAGTIQVDGAPAENAAVRISGRSYTGDSEEQITGTDGRFQAAVMRSEKAGEDVDRDGVTGERQTVDGIVRHNGKLYLLEEIDVPDTATSCEEGTGIVDLGFVTLSPDKEVRAGICQITGRVVDLKGKPVADVSVVASDSLVDSETFDGLCADGTSCDFITTTGADGTFTFRAPALVKLEIHGLVTKTENGVDKTRTGKTVTRGCPTSPVTIVLDDGYDYQKLTVTRSGNAIAWIPAVPLTQVFVLDASGNHKWVISSFDDPAIASPVAYGAVTPPAVQLVPENGAPPPIGPGDRIIVQGHGTSSDGFLTLSNGEIVVP